MHNNSVLAELQPVEQQQEAVEEVKQPQIQQYIEIISQIYPSDCVLTPTIIYTAKYQSQDVILKKILKNKINENGVQQAVQEQEFQTQFQHPNIVQGMGSYEDEDGYYIVMELVDQADYFRIKLIENYKPIRKDLKIKMYISDILQGIKYLHDQNIVHMDIKLENLFCQTIEKDSITFRRVKIGDFGVCKKVDPETKKVKLKNVCGTRDYMAPEIQSNSEIDLSVDIWAFGVTIYHMVTGYVPTRIAGFEYEEDQPIQFRKRDWRKIENGDKLQEFITKIFQYRPEDRPTVDELLNDEYLKI